MVSGVYFSLELTLFVSKNGNNSVHFTFFYKLTSLSFFSANDNTKEKTSLTNNPDDEITNEDISQNILGKTKDEDILRLL